MAVKEWRSERAGEWEWLRRDWGWCFGASTPGGDCCEPSWGPLPAPSLLLFRYRHPTRSCKYILQCLLIPSICCENTIFICEWLIFVYKATPSAFLCVCVIVMWDREYAATCEGNMYACARPNVNHQQLLRYGLGAVTPMSLTLCSTDYAWGYRRREVKWTRRAELPAPPVSVLESPPDVRALHLAHSPCLEPSMTCGRSVKSIPLSHWPLTQLERLYIYHLVPHLTIGALDEWRSSLLNVLYFGHGSVCLWYAVYRVEWMSEMCFDTFIYPEWVVVTPRVFI